MDGIAYIDVEEWKDCELPDKYHLKMKETAERWMVQQGAQQLRVHCDQFS